MKITREGLCAVLLLAVALTGCGARTLHGGEDDGTADDGDGGDSVEPGFTGGRPGASTGGRPGASTGGRPSAGTGGRPPTSTGGRPPTSTGGRPPTSTGGSPSVGGGGVTPWCPWGNNVLCRCTDEIYGVMDCLPDRSGYGPCVCGVPLPCDDGVRSGNETDTDCGGGECRACEDGWACRTDYDCLSLLCGGDGICYTPSCWDGALDGNETDVDCGGFDCEPCPDGWGCSRNADCQSGLCGPGYCVTRI